MNSHHQKTEYLNKKDEEILAASFSYPQLFEILVERHQDAFIRKAMRIVRNKEVAHDVVQDTFVRIYLYGKKFQPVEGATFLSWAYKILTNVCFLWYKKIKREKEFFSALDEDMEAILPTDDSAETEQNLDRDYLESMFSRMSETFAKVLRLYVVDGKSYKEIAKIEGSSENAIKIKMHRAKKELKKVSSLND